MNPMNCKTAMLLGAAVSSGLAGVASAAPVFTLSSNVSNYYAPADAGLSTPLPVPPKVNGLYVTPGFYQVDLGVHAGGLAANQSFGSVDWKYNLSGTLVTNSTFPDWQPDPRQVDTNGA